MCNFKIFEFIVLQSNCLQCSQPMVLVIESTSFWNAVKSKLFFLNKVRFQFEIKFKISRYFCFLFNFTTYFCSVPSRIVIISDLSFSFSFCTPAIGAPTALYVTNSIDARSVKLCILSPTSVNLPWSMTKVWKNKISQVYYLYLLYYWLSSWEFYIRYLCKDNKFVKIKTHGNSFINNVDSLTWTQSWNCKLANTFDLHISEF